MSIAEDAIFGWHILHGVLTYSRSVVCCLLTCCHVALLTFSALGHPYYYGYEDALFLMMYNKENVVVVVFFFFVYFYSFLVLHGAQKSRSSLPLWFMAF